MDKKKLIEDCVKEFENGYPFEKNEEKKKCTFFSGIKPANYYYYSPMFSAKQALEKVEMAWFCEIWFGNVCVYRLSLMPTEKYPMKKLENIMLNQIIQSVFSEGIFAAYKKLTD